MSSETSERELKKIDWLHSWQQIYLWKKVLLLLYYAIDRHQEMKKEQEG